RWPGRPDDGPPGDGRPCADRLLLERPAPGPRDGRPCPPGPAEEERRGPPGLRGGPPRWLRPWDGRSEGISHLIGGVGTRGQNALRERPPYSGRTGWSGEPLMAFRVAAQ